MLLKDCCIGYTGHSVPGGSGDIVVEPVLVNVHTEHDGRQQHQDVVVDDLHNKHCQAEHPSIPVAVRFLLEQAGHSERV